MKRENVFFAVLFSIVSVLALAVVQPFVPYVLLAAILTYTLFPVHEFIRQRTARPGLSSAISMILAMVIMVLPSFYIIQRLVQQVSGAYTSFQTLNIQRIGDYLSGLTGNQINFQDMLDSFFGQIRQSIVAIAPDVLGSVTELALGFFIMFFVMFYAFREGEVFVAYIKKLLPLDADLKEKLFSEIRLVTQAVLYGQMMTAVIQGSLGGLGFLIFGVSNWVFWGTIMIVFAFLPVMGTPIIFVPAAVDQILAGEMINGFGLLAYGAIFVMNIDNFIRPRLVSGKSKIHPVLILIGVLGGLRIFGFVGMLMGPLILAIFVAVTQFYEQEYLKRATADSSPSE